MTDLEISRAWLVDPAAGREGPGEIVVRDGTLEAVTWLEGAEADGIDDRGVVVAPGFIDLHAHLREPGNEDAETIATGPGRGRPWRLHDRLRDAEHDAGARRARGARRGSGRPAVASRIAGRAAADRRGDRRPGRARRWPPLGRARRRGRRRVQRRRGAGRSRRRSCGHALAYAGMLGLPIVDHPEDRDLTDGAEANDGLVATVLGLRGWPVAAEAGRGRAGPRHPRRRRARRARRAAAPDAPVHGRRRSTSSARAKAAGLPVTCDVTPHHLALTDEWLAGARRWAWDALDDDGDPRIRGGRRLDGPARTTRRCGSTRRSAAPVDAAAVPGGARRRHGRRGRHGPRAAHRGRQGGRIRARGERHQRHRDGARPAARGGRRRAAAAGAGHRGADDRPGAGPRRADRGGTARSGWSRARRRTSSSSIARSAGRSTPRRCRRAARTRRCSGASCRAGSSLTIAGGRLAYEAPDA